MGHPVLWRVEKNPTIIAMKLAMIMGHPAWLASPKRGIGLMTEVRYFGRWHLMLRIEIAEE